MNPPTVNRPFHDTSGLLHHVELSVADLRASTQFWDWLLTELGYARYQEWDRGVSWKRRETAIVLVQADTDEGESPPREPGAGLHHLAFHARSRRQVDDVARELQRRGVAVFHEEDPRRAGRGSPYAVYFEDPNRIQLELVAPD